MKSNRRSFLKQSSLAIASCSFISDNEVVADTAFVHHVLFWLKDNNQSENSKKMVKTLQAFRKLKEVKFLHVGSPSISDVDYEARATDITYTLSFLTLFDSRTDKENYLKDPLHLKFFDEFKDVVLKVVIYDSSHIDV